MVVHVSVRRVLLEEMPSKGLKADRISYAAAMQVCVCVCVCDVM